MADDVVTRVRNNPRFHELEAKRNRLGWTLSIIMLVIYASFILIVAFDKSFIAMSVGGVVTLAFPYGLAVILSAIIITGIYVFRANSEYDDLTRQIVEEAR